ncbi:hypothetical protein BT96DRAFT_1072594 [Gymnopus androsaceus JB14]|uniref:Transposase domain-containing protein n=1 Tax=Gymnopus androsaceus JB14 TaxID=1447944 RepID=A0A6A4GU78_9AGAR|nr:hypothetical protein BT96DRAFT_1072594 [Gymnopus androsaceus JB14]
MCLLLVAWLVLCKGISRRTASVILQALRLIIFTILQIIYVTLKGLGAQISAPSPIVDIPIDIRTVYSGLDLNPTLIRIICCPKCFKEFPANTRLQLCDFRKSPRARKCKTPLFRKQHTTNGKRAKLVPRCLYSTQSFESWLESLLSRSAIHECLHQTFAKSRGVWRPGEKMRDIYDSPGWQQHMCNFLQSPYHLAFAVYVDWFNPLGNKIAGKTVSCGAIALYCMNLPLEIRFLPENVFILGMMPIDGPTVWTIHHVMEPLYTQLSEFDLPGKLLRNGVMVAVRIYLTIADLQASKKITGFGSPSAKYLCSYCHIEKDDLENLDYAAFHLRDGLTVRTQAFQWKDAVLVKDKVALFKENGVRWTPLYKFPHYDPVRHTILGFMHNALEGLLEDHLRRLWGLGRTKETIKQIAEREADENFSQADTDEARSDIESLEDEEEDEEDEEMENADESSDDDEEEEEGSEESDEESNGRRGPTPPGSAEEDDPDFFPVPDGTFKFLAEQLQALRECIIDAMLASWVERPPSNLGEAKHGKLKAHLQLVLFCAILPLIIPEFWFNGDTVDRARLENFCHLVAAVSILAAYSTSDEEANLFGQYLTSYQLSMQQLYPQFHSLPNHHYAMHYPDILKFWGPVATLSEFPGERLNGELANIPTNNHFVEMEMTMIRQFAQKSNLKIRLEGNFEDAAAGELAHILEPNDPYLFLHSPPLLTNSEVAAYLAKGKELPRKSYDFLLAYLNMVGPQYLSAYSGIVHSRHTLVLPTAAQLPRNHKVDGRTFHTLKSMESGSHIYYYVPGAGSSTGTGCITDIWQLPLENVMRTFFFVQHHASLSPTANQWNPYSRAPCSVLRTNLVLQELSTNFHIIEPQHIICHLVVRKVDKKSYPNICKKIHKPVMLINWSLDRSRRGP